MDDRNKTTDYLTLVIKQVGSDLFCVTSPDVCGLMVAGRSLAGVLAEVPSALNEMTQALSLQARGRLLGQ